MAAGILSPLPDAEFLKFCLQHASPERKLTAAEIGELRREHAETIEPARQARAIRALEAQLSNLVNEPIGRPPRRWP